MARHGWSYEEARKRLELSGMSVVPGSVVRWRTLTTPSARKPEDKLPIVGLHGGSGTAMALRKPRHTCIRDWLRFSTIIGQKMAQPSARFLSSLGIRSISTMRMNLSTHPKQGLAKEIPATESLMASAAPASSCWGREKPLSIFTG